LPRRFGGRRARHCPALQAGDARSRPGFPLAAIPTGASAHREQFPLCGNARQMWTIHNDREDCGVCALGVPRAFERSSPTIASRVGARQPRVTPARARRRRAELSSAKRILSRRGRRNRTASRARPRSGAGNRASGEPACQVPMSANVGDWSPPFGTGAHRAITDNARYLVYVDLQSPPCKRAARGVTRTSCSRFG
jgi:hypothetical protein